MLRILRWLLVALLPFVGFYVGNRLSPEPRPVWENNYPHAIDYLGLIDDGHTLLYMERTRSTRESRGKIHALVGVNIADGKEVYRQQLPQALGDDSSITSLEGGLSLDGKTVLLINHHDDEVLLYDRQRQEVVKRFARTPKEPGTAIVHPMLHGKRLVLSGYTMSETTGLESRGFLVVWDTDSITPVKSIQESNDIYLRHLSDDGSMCHVARNKNSLNTHVVLETTTCKELINLGEDIWDVAWSADQKCIYALKREYDTESILTYELKGDAWQLVSTQRNLADGAATRPFGPTLSLANRTRHSLVRSLIEHYLGSNALALFNKLSPPQIVLSVYAAEPAQRIRTLSIPDTIPEPYARFDCYHDRALQGFFFLKDFSLAYWSFEGPTTWPRWLGLSLGLLLAALLARSNLKSARLTKR